MRDRIVYLFQEIRIKGRRQSDVADEEGITPAAISQYIKRHRADWQQLEKELADHQAKKAEWEQQIAEWKQQVEDLQEKKEWLSCWEDSCMSAPDKFTVGFMACMAAGEYEAEKERGPFGKHKEYITYTRDGDPSLHVIEKDKFTPDLLKGGDSQYQHPPVRINNPPLLKSDT